MRQVINFSDGWSFKEGFDPQSVGSPISGATVNIPHTAVEIPFSYADETSYQKCFTYQKTIAWDDSFAGREVLLRFEGAMANAAVYLNGQQVGSHVDGYTPFEVRLTVGLTKGTNLVTVKIDGSENPAIPPFGGKIDYMTYAGIYRDVALVVKSPVSIANVKVEPTSILKTKKGVVAYCEIANPDNIPLDGTLTASLLAQSGDCIAEQTVDVDAATPAITFENLEGIALWDIDAPNLYVLQLKLVTGAGIDSFETHFGFRTAEFTENGFFLNGRVIKLMGLNRHQSFPYSGYAQGRYAQERDAEILKHELSCNVVRTSHYPQSPWFLDHCDRIGLLVLTEIPGWQHIGDEAWQAESVRNVQRLITRDWNHPSIITWGVRINESEDNHKFYAATNAMARALDSTRQTSGIRKHASSELLEDIYTMNDFSQGWEEVAGGGRTVFKSQNEQTGLNKLVPYMVTECNGHMFPTKVNDQEQRQAEHVTRHLNVLNHAFGDPNSAGVISWCMFDYNTHKDFGSGDKICHHGVMTMFREPKFAAYAYASQGDPKANPVLKPVTFYARGERNIGGVLPLIILTNADEVALTFADGTELRFRPAVDRYPHLPHPPVIIERDDVTADAFGKWGMDWQDLEIAGYIDGKEIKSVILCADPLPTTLEVMPDKPVISAGEKEDLRVMVRALDQAGNILPFLADQASIAITGPAELIGPSHVPIVGGATGFWIKATGTTGAIGISIKTNTFQEVTKSVATKAN